MIITLLNCWNILYSLTGLFGFSFGALLLGGGPTPDKPRVTLSVLADPDKISRFMNIRVADIQACYELWKSRGANRG
jgi:hypothetical protein